MHWHSDEHNQKYLHFINGSFSAFLQNEGFTLKNFEGLNGIRGR